MSFVPAAEAAAPFLEHAAARAVTTGEAALATAALEGARYAGAIKSKLWKKARTTKKKYQKKMVNMITEGDMAKFGEPPGQELSKRVNQDYLGGNLGNVVYTMSAATPNRGDQIDQRQRDVVLMKGLKFCANFRRNLSGPASILVNFAIVSRKDDVDSNSNVGSRLFRSHNNQRAVDFNENLFSLRRHCDSINTDKYYVWTHRRFTLEQQDGNGNGEKMIKGYIPINRQLRFDPSNFPNAEMLFIWWCGLGNEENNPVSPTVQSFMNTNIVSSTYFDEPMPLGQMSQMLKQLKKSGTRRRVKRKRYSSKYAKRS